MNEKNADDKREERAFVTPQFSTLEAFNLETAVQDDKVMQNFELESLLMGGDHSQKVKAPPIRSGYGSKDCVNLSSSTAVSRFKHIRRIQIKTTKEVNDVFAGAYHSIFKGRGIEFEDARPYQPGDDERNIDWNVTARMNFPFVKNFKEERELTVMLLVDVSASSKFSSSGQLKSELIAEIGAILAFSAIKNNDKVGLVLFSNEIELYLPPKRGLRHVLRVIRELLFFIPKHPGTDMSKALFFFGQVQQRRSVCFLISDFLCEGYNHNASLIAKRHDLIAISVNDPLEKAFPSVGLVNLRDLETGQEKLIDTSSAGIQQQYLKRNESRIKGQKELINKIGASLITIQTDQDYIQALHHFFKQRGQRR
jgi:uncharacterized protein (DUF58 family)